ncbi:DUF222 domain-containing protein [Microlunatus flavus]|nr:DUF222 domain-containing protein [Microlunatus flavus]
MFDPAVEVATAAQLAERIADAHARLVEAECEELVLAAAWADAHYLDPDGTRQHEFAPVVERSVAWGGDGCPPVSEHCALELGALRGTGATTARMLITDALDVRHRLPRLWALVRAGSVRQWQARAVAQATHALSWDQAVAVDARLSGFLPLLPWPRFRRLLTAAVLDADPEAARERAEAAATSVGVWAFEGEHGLKTLVAKASSGDVTWFLAVVDRIAGILALEGDRGTADVRRAKAVGVLAQPARALALLVAHAGDEDRRTSEPRPADPDDEPDPRPDPSLDLRVPAVLGAGRDGGALDDATLARLARAARPRVVLHLHLSDATLRSGEGLVRPEHGDALTLAQLREWLVDTGCSVTVRPVVDPVATAAVDAYEVPGRLRDALVLRHPVDVFPFGQATSRTLDADHTVPFVPLDRGGPPGQTGLHNLGPLTRRHHRAVTAGRWRRRQPVAGTYLFRSPTGFVFAVTNQGTLRLGRSAFTDALWDLAASAGTWEEARLSVAA